MLSDRGSRHAPDVEQQLKQAQQRTEEVRQLTEQEAQDLLWMCKLVECPPPANLALPPSAAAAAAAASPSSPTPLLRVHLHDGRVYQGRLHCVDSASNLILSHASQVSTPLPDGRGVGGYSVGQVLIAWRLVQKVEQQKL